MTRMLALAELTKDKTKEFFFILKPSPGSRKIHIVRHETEVMMKEIIFVSKDHILFQFDAKFVPIKVDGQVKDAELNSDTKNQAVIFKLNGQVVT